jgi:hypothetical protein
MRRCRARQHRQAIILKIEIDAKDIDALVAIGALTIDQRQDRDAIAAAVWKLSEAGYKAVCRANAAPASQA